MELDATPGNRKRTLDDIDDEAVTPASAFKKRKIEEQTAASPSTPKALSAIALAISGVFGYNKQPVETNVDQPSPGGQNAPAENGLPNPKVQNVAPSPSKPRPAIKLAALLGSKWDSGDARSPSPKKGTPGKKAPSRADSVTPTPRKRGRPKKSEAVPVVPEPEDVEPQEIQDTPSKDRSVKKLAFMSSTEGHLDSTTADEFSASEIHGISPLKNRSLNLNERLAASTGAPLTPKGILSPSKKQGSRPRKSVTFNKSADGEVYFEDLPKQPSTKKKPGRKPKQAPVVVAEDEIRCGICAKPDSVAPNEIILCDNCDFAVHQVCYGVEEIPAGEWLCKSCTQEDVLNTPKKPAEGTTTGLPTTITSAVDMSDIPNLDHHLRTLQRVLLDRCVGRRRIRMFGQQEQYEKAQQLLEQTVVAGEGNSMLLIGPRGCGKTTMVENIIQDLSSAHGQDFHVIRLNGFIHTDDKLALKEIWRQLGKEMQVEDDLLNRSNYADIMASLLALLSHPSEILGTDDGITSQSIIFIIDEFDMFAAHPRQTLLYNLFDIAQSRKAPIAVLGCTTRLDVVEMLEKRVKSRFSHRYLYLSFPKNLAAYWHICRQGLMLGDTDPANEGLDASMSGFDEFHKYWNNHVEELYKHRSFQDLLQYHYYTTKSPSAFFTEWILPLSALKASNPQLDIPPVGSELTSLAPPDSRMQLLSTLSDLDLGLLIAAARLDIVADTDTVNFAMAYDEYSSLVGRQRVQSATSGMLAVGGNTRVWSRGVAGVAWERLITLGLLVPAGVGGVGAGSRTHGHGGLDGKMWKVDVALEEIPTATKLSTVLAKWCKEI